MKNVIENAMNAAREQDRRPGGIRRRTAMRTRRYAIFVRGNFIPHLSLELRETRAAA